jgi:hypothetical protein
MTRCGLLAIMALILVVPARGAAQSSSPGWGNEDIWWAWALPRLEQIEELRAPADDLAPLAAYDSGIPNFCRTGDGHPESGWAWCAERGYEVGWEAEPWDAVAFNGGDRDRSILAGREVREVLGSEAYRALLQAAWERGLDRPIIGRWLDSLGVAATVFQVVAGGLPLAELTDLDGDDQVDAVLLMSPTWE